MSLPSHKEVKERILAGFDRKYYDSIYTQQCYAFGQKWDSKPSYLAESSASDDIPIYPDVRVTHLAIGQSRRILNASIRTLSRVLSRAPEPKFPQVDEVTNEVRRTFWLANANGNRGVPTRWLQQLQYAFVEGDTLGVGCVKHGLRTHPRSGRQMVDMRHVPVLQTIWDPFEFDPRNSKWAAVASYVPYEVAKNLWGKKKADRHKREWTTTVDSRSAQFVRVIEYWDVGYAGDGPAYCIFVGDLEDGEVGENDLGFIPLSFCVNYVAPGMRRPIGRAVMQMSSQELINDIEKYLRVTMKRGPAIDIYMEEMFDEAALARWRAGDSSQPLAIKEGMVDDVRKAFTRIGAMDPGQGALALFAIAERQHNDDSNQTEQSRGNALGGRTTAREVSALVSKVNENASLTDQQANEFLVDAVKNTMSAALAGDAHPVSLDIFGSNILFNDPSDPMMDIANWLSEDSGTVLIDLESTSAEDDLLKRQVKKEDLMFLSPLVGVTLDPDTYSEEMLEAIGEKDIERWRIKQAPQQVFGQTAQGT